MEIRAWLGLVLISDDECICGLQLVDYLFKLVIGLECTTIEFVKSENPTLKWFSVYHQWIGDEMGWSKVGNKW